MFEILDNIYIIDRFLLVAFVKYILSQIYSHCIRNCTFRYFLEIVETFSKFFIYFFNPKTSNFHNPGMVGRRKLPDSPMNNIVNVLSIGLQYTLSLNDLKCQSLKFKTSVLYEILLFLKQTAILIHFLNLLIVTELLLWNRKDRG